MDITRLRALRELSVLGTMTAVADAMSVSASAVSQQIALLETEVGIGLVERRGRRVRLTPAGQRLVRYAETIFGIIEAARTDIAALKQVVSGEIRIVSFSSAAVTLLPAVMIGLRAQHPELRMISEEAEPSNGLAALKAWQADIALIDDLMTTHGVPEATIETRPVMEDRLYVLLSKSHPLSVRTEIALADLKSESWALGGVDNPFSVLVLETCRAAGFEPDVSVTCHGFETVLAMVEAGCCVSVQPGLRLAGSLDRIRAIPLHPTISRKISVAFRRGESRNPAIAALLDLIAQAALARTGICSSEPDLKSSHSLRFQVRADLDPYPITRPI